MKEIYSQHTLNEFFEEFKNLPSSYKIEQVHQLLNNPNAKATHKVNLHSKHLKLIIMTSGFLISIVATFLWLTLKNNHESKSINEIHKTTTSVKNIGNISTIDSNIKDSSTVVNEVNPIPSDPMKIERFHEKSIQTKNTFKEKIKNNIAADHKKESISDEDSSIEYINCDWPADTIIDKKILLVELTDSELNEIGIVKYGNEIYYNNVTSNGKKSSHYSDSETIPIEKKVQTNFDFRFLTRTTINYVPIQFFDADIFYSSMDTLVPIILRVGSRPFPPYQDIIYWFNPHETLFEKLPERYNYLQNVYSNLCCLKTKYPNKSFTNYLSSFGNNIYDPVNSINLNKEELQQIGVNVIENCIVLLSNDSKNYSEFCTCSDCGREQSYYDSIDIVRVNKSSVPVLITDTLGRKIQYDGNPKNRQIIEKNMNILIPIKIDKDKLLNKKGYKTELWWYYPSDEFIQTLPDRIKNELKPERDAIISNENIEATSCTYFEVCKSTLNLDKLKLYPNPAVSTITLEFDSPENITGSISIVNISGSIVKELLPTASILTGHNSYVFELSDIVTGIYLISIITDKGFKTQRLIVSQ